MEKIMVCPPARDSIAKEVEECESLVIDIPPDLPHAEWREYCIYRVPKQLRKVNEEAYTPKLVSIGPVHHRATELKDMEKHKRRYLKHFLDRTQKSEEDLRKIIEDNKDEICRSYSEDCGLESGDDFVTMVLLDAIFIIELFLKTENKEDDYILSKAWLRHGILHDLILFENQLPFFVLAELYMFAFNEYSSSCNHHQEGQRNPFVQLSRKYFEYYDEDRKSIISEEVKHLTDLVRHLFCSVPGLRMTPRVYTGSLYSATKLDYAGLKFKPIPVRKRSLLDITFSFKSSLLRVSLKISNNTKSQQLLHLPSRITLREMRTHQITLTASDDNFPCLQYLLSLF